MREYNENNIGKLVMKNIGCVYMVSGYDFLSFSRRRRPPLSEA